MKDRAIMNYDDILGDMAKVGYETMFDAKWDDLPEISIERELWLNIAREMFIKLWSLFKAEQEAKEIKGELDLAFNDFEVLISDRTKITNRAMQDATNIFRNSVKAIFGGKPSGTKG